MSLYPEGKSAEQFLKDTSCDTLASLVEDIRFIYNDGDCSGIVIGPEGCQSQYDKMLHLMALLSVFSKTVLPLNEVFVNIQIDTLDVMLIRFSEFYGDPKGSGFSNSAATQKQYEGSLLVIAALREAIFSKTPFAISGIQ